MTTDYPHLRRDFVGYGANPPDPRWPGGARLALNLCINYEEGGEPSVPDGDAESETGLTEGGAGGFAGRDLAARIDVRVRQPHRLLAGASPCCRRAA